MFPLLQDKSLLLLVIINAHSILQLKQENKMIILVLVVLELVVLEELKKLRTPLNIQMTEESE